MKAFQRILAVMLALVLSLSVLGTVAFASEVVTPAATIDTTKTGSIAITKYEYNGTTDPAYGDGTADPDTIPNDATLLSGVTFTAYKVMDATEVVSYYNGNASESVTVDSYLDNGAIKSEYTSAGTAITNDSGVATFSGLAVGMYVIIETAAPDKVTTPAAPFLVSIPMTDPNNIDWMYDVHVYPKNSTSEGNVTLKKLGENSAALQGVTFTLEKKNGENWETVSIDNKSSFSTDTNGEIKFTGLAHGTYRVTETATVEGYILDARPIEFTVTTENKITCTSALATVSISGNNEKALTINITNEKPDVTKTATTNKDVAGVGGTVSYELTLEIPENITAMKTYTVKDVPAGLNVDNSTIKVKLGDNEVTGFYTAPATGDEDTTDGFTIVFAPKDMGAYAGETLTITYDAIVLASAATNNTATNTATLTYSDVLVPEEDYNPDDPTDPGNSTDEDEDDEETKNFKISIVKYKDSVADVNKAAGVEFELYSDAALTKKVTVTGSAGNYVVAEAGTTATTTTLVTGSNGELVVSGLAAGTYYLKETKAPNEYNLLSDEIKIELNITDETDLTYTQNIINKKGFTLPQTGGLGTLMFIIIGGVLIAGGVCLITVPNKKRAV